MARDPDGLLIEKWAETGDVRTPEDRGITRSVGWTPDFSAKGGLQPSREVFNQLFRELTGHAVDVQTHGVLEWGATGDYEHPALVLGPTTGRPYLSTRNSGPAHGGAVNPEGAQSSTAWTQDIVQGVNGSAGYAVTVGQNDGAAVVASLTAPKFVRVSDIRDVTPPSTEVVIDDAARAAFPYLAVSDIASGAQTDFRSVYRGGYFHGLRLHAVGPDQYAADSPIYLQWIGGAWNFSPTPRAGERTSVGTALSSTQSGQGVYDVELDFTQWWQVKVDQGDGTIAFGVDVGRNDGAPIAASIDAPRFVRVNDVYGFNPPKTRVIIGDQSNTSLPYLALTNIPAGDQTTAIPAVYRGGYFHGLRLHAAGPDQYAADAQIYLQWVGGEWVFTPTPRAGERVAVGTAFARALGEGQYDVELDFAPWWHAKVEQGSGTIAAGVDVGRNDGAAVVASTDAPAFVRVSDVYGFTPPKTRVIIGDQARTSLPYLALSDIPAGDQTTAIPAVYRGGFFHGLRLHADGPAQYANDAPVYLRWLSGAWVFSPIPRAGERVAVGTAFQLAEGPGRYDVELDFAPWWHSQVDQGDGTIAFGVDVGRNDGAAVVASTDAPAFVRVSDVFGLTPPKTSTIIADEAENSLPYLAVTNIPAGDQTTAIPAVYRGGYFHGLRLHADGPQQFNNDTPVYLVWDSGGWQFSPTPGTGRWGRGVSVGTAFQLAEGPGRYDVELDFATWWHAQSSEGLGVSSSTYEHNEWTGDDLYDWLSPALRGVGESVLVTGSMGDSGNNVQITSRAERTSDTEIRLYTSRAATIDRYTVVARQGSTAVMAEMRNMAY